MNRRSGWILSALSLVAACRSEPAIWVPAVTDDPAVATADFDAPLLRFDGGGGSLFAADGWTRHRRAQDGTTAAIARGARSLLLFPPQPGPRELLLSCRSIPSGRDGALTVRLFHGGRERSSATLPAEWSQIRLPFGDAELGEGLQSAELRFASSGVEPDARASSEREVRWARCRALAVVPPGAPWPERSSPAAAPSARSVPIPPWSRGEIELPAAASADAPPQLAATLRPRAGASRDLARWRRDADGAWRTEFENDSAEPAELRLGPTAAGSSRPEPTGGAAAASIRWTRRAGAAQPDAHPDIFVYVVDTLRTDSVLAAGAGAPATRDLARFAADALTFERAWSPSSWTLPAMASLLTGESPHRHGLADGSLRLAAEGPPTLAERLASVGYQTLGLSQSWVVSDRYGLDRGFERFLLSDQLNGAEHRAQDLRGQLRQWLVHQARFDRPLFVLLHTVEPHGPYSAPLDPGAPPPADEDESMAPLRRRGAAGDAAAVRRWRDRYEAEAGLALSQFARFLRLLESLDLYRRSAILFVSDHGEEFGEHGGFEHGRTLRSEQTRVPALLKLPDGELAGTRVHAPISTLDLAATLADLAGQAPQGRVADSVSLLPELRRGSPRPRPIELSLAVGPSEAYGGVHLEGLVLDEVQCELNLDATDRWSGPAPDWSFWNVASAVGSELRLEPGSPAAAACRARLERLLEERRSRRLAPPPDVGAEEKARLRALGYIR